MQNSSSSSSSRLAVTHASSTPYASLLVGVACVAAYAVPHTTRYFAPARPSTWLAPAFEHAGPLHLLFNLYWLNELAAPFERAVARPLPRLGPPALAPAAAAAACYALIGFVSNAAQYAASGPYFLGLSGVVFGMVGFLAVASPPGVGADVVRFFAAWFVICVALTGLGLLPIANAAHGGGAAAGALLGLLFRAGGRPAERRERAAEF